jgi:hypothetical protein
LTLDEVRTLLFTAAKLRMPRFGENDTTGMRVEKLENYLLTMAVTRGDLEEGRLYIQQTLRTLQLKWDTLQGWEIHAPAAGKARTKVAIREAKALTDPALHDALQECVWLIARLTEQINRLSKMGDDQVASRIYTLIAGA